MLTGTRTRVRHMDLAPRREEWIADPKTVLQSRKQETGDVMAANFGQEGGDDIDVEFYLHREAVLLSAPRKSTVRHKTVSRRERLERVWVEWSQQLDTLSDTYLKWKQGSNADLDPCSGYRPNQSFPSVDEDPFVNVTLIKRGFLGPVPTYPTTLFSLAILEACRVERLQDKRWSFAQKAKALCQRHNVTYRSSLGAQLQDAFNVYLSILDNIKPGPSS
ncbi:hypothetical protein FS837_006035 [Tulasnella sp. UAMH 9824]|nr:hypothetical protein FS837_006035 [Tulasnella sp. UAMH 9824]